jgi:hypothetical protein
MTKTIFALATAGILGAAILPAQATMVPASKSTTMQTTQTRQEAQLNRDRQLLKRDVRLHRASAAAKLRREISADERSINRAKQGGQSTTGAQSMQPNQPTIPASQMPNQSTTQPQDQTNTNK